MPESVISAKVHVARSMGGEDANWTRENAMLSISGSRSATCRVPRGVCPLFSGGVGFPGATDGMDRGAAHCETVQGKLLVRYD